MTAEEAYERPGEFLPQRWHKQPELVKDKRSFLPFAQGRYTCLGKNLALAELRTVTSMLVSKFHVNFAPGQNVAAVEENLQDQFTACPGELKLAFTPRSTQ